MLVNRPILMFDNSNDPVYICYFSWDVISSCLVCLQHQRSLMTFIHLWHSPFSTDACYAHWLWCYVGKGSGTSEISKKFKKKLLFSILVSLHWFTLLIIFLPSLTHLISFESVIVMNFLEVVCCMHCIPSNTKWNHSFHMKRFIYDFFDALWANID